jgi:hypothetical protein
MLQKKKKNNNNNNNHGKKINVFPRIEIQVVGTASTILIVGNIGGIDFPPSLC